MTTTGKVFTVLSLLLGLAFLYFVTPIAKQLIETQQQIVNIEKQHPPLKESTNRLETERLSRVYELNRQKARVAAELTKSQNQADVVRSQLSLLTDLEKAERQAVVTWQKTVSDLKGEMEARNQEKTELDEAIASNSAERDAQTQKVTELREQLEQTRQKLDATLRTLASDYEKLEKSQPTDDGTSEDPRVALER